MANDLLSYVLAAHKAATVAQIQGVTDADLQTAVDAAAYVEQVYRTGNLGLLEIGA